MIKVGMIITNFTNTSVNRRMKISIAAEKMVKPVCRESRLEVPMLLIGPLPLHFQKGGATFPGL